MRNWWVQWIRWRCLAQGERQPHFRSLSLSLWPWIWPHGPESEWWSVLCSQEVGKQGPCCVSSRQGPPSLIKLLDLHNQPKHVEEDIFLDGYVCGGQVIQVLISCSQIVGGVVFQQSVDILVCAQVLGGDVFGQVWLQYPLLFLIDY